MEKELIEEQIKYIKLTNRSWDGIRRCLKITIKKAKQEYYDEIKVFLNCEVRNASKEVEEGIEKYRNALKKQMKKHLK